MDFFAEALQSDVSDVQQGTTRGGRHSAPCGNRRSGAARIDGIEVRGDVLRLNPELPREMERLDLRIATAGIHSICG